MSPVKSFVVKQNIYDCMLSRHFSEQINFYHNKIYKLVIRYTGISVTVVFMYVEHYVKTLKIYTYYDL